MEHCSPVSSKFDVIEDEADDLSIELFGAECFSSGDRPMISTPNAAPLIPSHAAGDRFVGEFDEEVASTSLLSTNQTDTPKTSRAVRNPFDQRALDNLANSTCSPSMFRYKKEKRKRLMAFEWTIEQRSQVLPAQIPEDGTSTSPGLNSPAFERRAEAALNQYWQGVHLPSPDVATLTSVTRRTENLLFASSTPTADVTSSEYLSDDETMDEKEEVTDEKMDGDVRSFPSGRDVTPPTGRTAVKRKAEPHD